MCVRVCVRACVCVWCVCVCVCMNVTYTEVTLPMPLYCSTQDASQSLSLVDCMLFGSLLPLLSLFHQALGMYMCGKARNVCQSLSVVNFPWEQPLSICVHLAALVPILLKPKQRYCKSAMVLLFLCVY